MRDLLLHLWIPVGGLDSGNNPVLSVFIGCSTVSLDG